MKRVDAARHISATTRSASQGPYIAFLARIGGLFALALTLARASAAEPAAMPAPAPKPPIPGVVIEGDLEFGRIRTGDHAERKVTLRNTGTNDFKVLAASVPTGFSVVPQVFGLATGAVHELTIRFTPLTARAYEGKFEVTEGAGASASSMPVSGTGSAPHPGQVAFGALSYQVNESASGIEIVVERKGGRDGAISINYNTPASGGSATWRVDYEPASGVLSWADGDDAPKSFTLHLIDDRQFEGREFLVVELYNPKGGATIAGPSRVEVRIMDNDMPGIR